jgi:hypothetical protein
MAKIRSKGSVNNGGMFGSGIFGMVGSTVHCKAEDNSMYCTLSKMVSSIMMILFLLFMLCIIYIGYKYFRNKK